MNEKVVIVGAGGHAKVVADTVRKRGDVVLGFLDDDDSRRGTDFFGSKILGRISEYEQYSADARFILAIGNNAVRRKLSCAMTCAWYTAIHPTAIIGEGVAVGEGSFIGAGAVINPDAVIGSHTIINTRTVIEHDCTVGPCTHVSPNATLCGGVSVGANGWIGAGAAVIQGIHVCDGVTVGAGAVVVKSIEQSGTYVGVPAKRLDKEN